MLEAVASPYLIADGGLNPDQAATAPPAGAPDAMACRERLRKLATRIAQQQRLLSASGKQALLIIFQGMDAAGKDSTLRAVFQRANPAGFRVHAFAQPSREELAHDFLWRSTRQLPARGQIGVFNRSYYEEVLVARVHPQLLAPQGIDPAQADAEFWLQRYQSIRDHELHLARNNTVLLKFWLHLSPSVQHKRFLKRLRRPEKHWKFALADVEERRHWAQYLQAYRDAVAATSRPWAPWYVIPADRKPFLRLQVAEIVSRTLAAMAPRVPEPEPARQATLQRMRARLEGEDPAKP